MNLPAKKCRRCQHTDATAHFDPLVRTICKACRRAEIDARPPRYAPEPGELPKSEPVQAKSCRNALHLAYVREQPCAVRLAAALQPGVKGCLGITHAHHVRIATGGGMGMKPDDMWCVPLCGYHHAELHTRGARTFEARYGVDLRAMAERLATRSPSLNQNNEA